MADIDFERLDAVVAEALSGEGEGPSLGDTEAVFRAYLSLRTKGDAALGEPLRHRALVHIIAQKASVGLKVEEELKELDALFAATKADSGRGVETEEQAAELGAWLVAHPGWTFELGDGYAGPANMWRCLLFRPHQGPLSERIAEFAHTKAAAIRAALKAAKERT